VVEGDAAAGAGDDVTAGAQAPATSAIATRTVPARPERRRGRIGGW